MDSRVQKVINFMNANLHRKISPAEVAQSVRLSPSRLREVFKDQTGKSFAQYRKELRLERARQLLETTFLSIKEIAASVGLTSVSHFISDFKEAYRMTPSEYAEYYREGRETR
jgi:two-component system response regulator YesN